MQKPDVVTEKKRCAVDRNARVVVGAPDRAGVVVEGHREPQVRAQPHRRPTAAAGCLRNGLELPEPDSRGARPQHHHWLHDAEIEGHDPGDLRLLGLAEVQSSKYLAETCA